MAAVGEQLLATWLSQRDSLASASGLPVMDEHSWVSVLIILMFVFLVRRKRSQNDDLCRARV